MSAAEAAARAIAELLEVDFDSLDDENRLQGIEVAVTALAAGAYEPPHLRELVESISYKPGWMFYLSYEPATDGSGGLALHVVSHTEDSFNFERRIRVNHEFLVPAASWNRDVWAAWLFDRIRDVETHEAGEFFRLDGVREFAPHHSNGEDPYRVWHASDWATAAKSSGDV